MIAIVLLSALTILTSFYVYLTWNINYWTKRGVNGPKPRIIVGTYPNTGTVSFRESGYKFLTEAHSIFLKFYKSHRFIGSFEGVSPRLMILDPSLAKDIYVKHFKSFHNNFISDTLEIKTDKHFARNPFFQRDKQWKKTRSEISAAFTVTKLKPMYSIINEICQRLIVYIDNQRSDLVNARDLSNRFTAEVISNCIFGLEAQAFQDRDIFLTNAENCFAPTIKTNILFKLFGVFPFLRKFIANPYATPELDEWFLSLTKQAIEVRKQNGVSRDDYFNFIFDLKEKKNLTDEEASGHIFTFFLDGFETSSHFIAYAISELAKNKNVQEKLRIEANSVENVDWDQINQLPYLDNVFNEILRHSPFPFPLWKKCTEDIEIEDFDATKLQVKKGEIVHVPVYSFHHHPGYYTDVDTFWPERFDEFNDDLKKLKDVGAFMPFGNGPRVCLGMRFATTQIKAAIFTIVKHFEVLEDKTSKKIDKIANPLQFPDNQTAVHFNRLK